MSEKLTKRDLILFGMMFFAPFLSFIICVWDDSVLESMMNEPWMKAIAGFCASIFWMGVWTFALVIDKVLKNMEEKRNVEFDDPSMAYGQYLFDKKKV